MRHNSIVYDHIEENTLCENTHSRLWATKTPADLPRGNQYTLFLLTPDMSGFEWYVSSLAHHVRRGSSGVICDVISGFFENIRIIPLNDRQVAKNTIFYYFFKKKIFSHGYDVMSVGKQQFQLRNAITIEESTFPPK